MINVKVKQWLHDPTMKTYLRPSTLFSPTNFENYLIEAKENRRPARIREIKPIELDFTLGEEDWIGSVKFLAVLKDVDYSDNLLLIIIKFTVGELWDRVYPIRKE